MFTSLPTGIPLPRPAVKPMTLAMKALRVRYSFRTTPLRMVFSSGMPEPVKRKKEKEKRERDAKHLSGKTVNTVSEERDVKILLTNNRKIDKKQEKSVV